MPSVRLLALLAAGALGADAARAAEPALAQGTLERIRETTPCASRSPARRPTAIATRAGEVTGEAPAIARAVLERIDPGRSRSNGSRSTSAS